MASGERYAGLLISFVTLPVVSRLLTPAEIGVSVVGLAITTLILSVREFATTSFIIQHRDLQPTHVHASFTFLLLVSVLISSVLTLLSGSIAEFYGEPRLAPYLCIGAVSISVEVVGAMVAALLRRNMAFGTLAIINISGAAVGASVTLALASLGFSYMSFAWATLASTITIAIMSLFFWRDWSIFRLSLHAWGGMAEFGGYNGLNVMLYRIYEALPSMALGRVLSFEHLALYTRAITLCQLPDRAVLRGLDSILLPAFSIEVRNGRSLVGAYVRSIEIITAIQWPALVTLAILADPLVRLILGAQWEGSVPLVRIMAIASMFSFSAELNYPVLMAMGAMRDIFKRSLIAWPISALVIVCAAMFGVMAAASAWLVTLPFQAYVSIWFVQRHVDISWKQLARAVIISGIVTLFSAVGPLLAVVLSGSGQISYLASFVAAALSAVGWIVGLKLTGHTMFSELEKILVHILLLPSTRGRTPDEAVGRKA
ncbi:exopolysaccharide exporter [Hyphomicrobium denitrificans 1NES1]|uniref:Exopolysaccharide exporter n=1 Tax=Hyphomicrobium denitrificans 1NES1 TaxID=670307 RepID=N0B277_9HYPH|nr:oligosaccharide flippase family protein [Hyphomicrobium denitrificans]AGK57589.1 exopolysaccharide exporter [Hyphomicrobium denitrificans 1NES1]